MGFRLVLFLKDPLLLTSVVFRLLPRIFLDFSLLAFSFRPPLNLVIVPWFPCSSFFAVSLASASRRSLSQSGAFEA